MGEATDTHWDHEDYCAAIEAEVARSVELIGAADPATPVPTCPGWTIAALVRHLGAIHRWVEHIMRHRAQERVRSRDVEVRPPGDETGYAAWLAAGTDRLVAELRAAAPGTPVWTWGADQHAHWWSRRMFHEALVHRADAEIALGNEPHIGADAAIDGVEEFLGNLAHAGWIAERLAGLGGDGETLHLHATDCDGEWTITLRPGGFGWERGHGRGTVAVRGTASELLLLTYGRLAPADGRFTVFGDDRVLQRWLKASAF